jgi:hypothetical protein
MFIVEFMLAFPTLVMKAEVLQGMFAGVIISHGASEGSIVLLSGQAFAQTELSRKIAVINITAIVNRGL